MLPTFHNQALFVTALTHRSALNEHLSTSTESNERLEYLGDAVLELATTIFLFNRFPDEPEGILTAYRSALVKTTTLAEVARELGLGEKLYMSKGEEAGGGRNNVGLLANVVEATLGALYLDQGFDQVVKFLNEHLFPKFENIYNQKAYKDPKSDLQEKVQAQGKSTPTYEVLDEVGPDHDKIFTVAVAIDGQQIAQGTGKSKQTAQQAAAEKALEII